MRTYMCRGEVTLITGSRCASTSINLFFLLFLLCGRERGGGLKTGANSFSWNLLIPLEQNRRPRAVLKYLTYFQGGKISVKNSVVSVNVIIQATKDEDLFVCFRVAHKFLKAKIIKSLFKMPINQKELCIFFNHFCSTLQVRERLINSCICYQCVQSFKIHIFKFSLHTRNIFFLKTHFKSILLTHILNKFSKHIS